jgi:ubiquinone biosynthesis protein UbiJ
VTINPTPQLPPKTGTELLHEEMAALRAQLAQLAQRVQALEQAQRPQPVAVTTVFDLED